MYFYIDNGGDSMTAHDDVMAWKPFPYYWPFVRRIHQSPGNSPQKQAVMWRFNVHFVAKLNKALQKVWQSFDVFFVGSSNKLLNKQSSCLLFDMPWGSCDVIVVRDKQFSINCVYKVYEVTDGPNCPEGPVSWINEELMIHILRKYILLWNKDNDRIKSHAQKYDVIGSLETKLEEMEFSRYVSYELKNCLWNRVLMSSADVTMVWSMKSAQCVTCKVGLIRPHSITYPMWSQWNSIYWDHIHDTSHRIC